MVGNDYVFFLVFYFNFSLVFYILGAFLIKQLFNLHFSLLYMYMYM